MYHYVEDKEFLLSAQACCTGIMHNLEDVLRSEYEIACQIFLVGSGARNMVTQNEDESIDFDYNLNILNGFDYDERVLKQTVIKALNKVMRAERLRDVEDSTSSITTKPIYFTSSPDIEFKIDVCIVTKDDDGCWHRLVHNKTGFVSYDTYEWNKAPISKHYSDKADDIKGVGAWGQVREMYLRVKNKYLHQNDHNHPSFICYIEAINNVYNALKQKKVL